MTGEIVTYCRHCRRNKIKYAISGLCQNCARNDDLRQQYGHKRESADDGSKPRLAVLKIYPDHLARRPCECKRAYEDECPWCERKQRGQVVMIAEETSGENDEW